jgi:hypothetical protein
LTPDLSSKNAAHRLIIDAFGGSTPVDLAQLSGLGAGSAPLVGFAYDGYTTAGVSSVFSSRLRCSVVFSMTSPRRFRTDREGSIECNSFRTRPFTEPLGSGGGLYPVYVRGDAFLAAHQGSEAAAEFQKILNHRGIVLNSPIGALAHLQVGRA